MMGGEGPRTVAIMWALTAVVFVFLLLRLYTRVFIVRSIGADDHMYFWSWVFLFMHNLFVHIAANYGFGQDQHTLSLDDAAMAHKWELVGQTFIILGMGMSKMSLALFLLRIVVVRWHRLSIWGVGGSLLFASCMTAILCWLQCLPAQRIYDSRVDGYCIIQPVPWAILLGCYCVFVDIFFAIFPWIFIRKLEMKKKEKAIVGISLSFGILAAICGIVRTINLPGLGSENYTGMSLPEGDTVALVVWCAAEMAVTLACIAVPSIIPLYMRIARNSSAGRSGPSTPFQKRSQATADTPVELRPVRSRVEMPFGHEDERKMGVNDPFTEVNPMYTSELNQSEEAILRRGHSAGHLPNGIMVTEEISVSSRRRSRGR